ncbi:uncharacterized protein [Argopecten irradians]|uniref:uncharacterized protein n=1 Tax=Argopecten irradians TaxID=31199 RepID=UPI00371CFE6B
MERWFAFTVCVLILDMSLGLTSPSMVGDWSTDQMLLQVQRLLLKHEAQIEALQKENIRLSEKSSTLEEEVQCLREKTVSLEEKIVTLEGKITSLEQDQPTVDMEVITRPYPEESGSIDESRITRQPKDGVRKISKRVDEPPPTDSIIAFHAILTHHHNTIPATPSRGVEFDKMVTNITFLTSSSSKLNVFICPRSWRLQILVDESKFLSIRTSLQ